MGAPEGWPWYQVVESQEFAADVQGCLGSFERWDEIKELLDKDVARNPTAFPAVYGTAYRLVTLLTDPPRTIFFLVDEDRRVVTLEAMR